VDLDAIEKLAAINCSVAEIAAVVGVDRRTIQRRYAALIEKGRETGKSSLKRKMWKIAMDNENVTMCIWLSKQMLGYTDKVEQRQNVNLNQKEVVEIQWADENDSQNASQDASTKANQREH
jgi:hypothetical protein